VDPDRAGDAQTQRMTMRPARVWVVSQGQLSRWMHRLEPEYRGRAEIGFVDETFDAAVARLRELEAMAAVDVLVSAGSNGAYLRRLVRSPIALVHVNGFDVLRALARAGAHGRRIAIMTYEDIEHALDDLRQLTHLDLTLRRYSRPDEAEATMRELIDAGHRVFVGPSLITGFAERFGVHAEFIYSESSVRKALDDAIGLATLSFEEQWRRSQLETVLGRLEEGVVGVDMNEHIWSINARMEQIAGVTRDWALGKRLGEVAPGLGLEATLRSGRSETNAIARVGTRTVVVNRIPLLSDGQVTGAVLTCQEAGVIRRAEEAIRRDARPGGFRARYRIDDLLGDSEAIERVRSLARLWARTDSTILITGESGTGKEMLAQGVHLASPRAAGPFVAVNCAAIPESLIESELFGHDEGAFTGARRGGRAGLVESARDGTVFLDEVTEMPLPAQARLLRVLQEREIVRVGATEPIPVDVRFVAATNRDLGPLIAEGRFRADLYFRLNVLRLSVPPLRERTQDIPAIARAWLARAVRRGRAAPVPAWDGIRLERWLPALQRHAWPGNVRELENVLERLVAGVSAYGSDVLEARGGLFAVAPELLEGGAPAAAVAASGRASGPADGTRRTGRGPGADQVRAALARAGGSVEGAARALGVSRTTVWRRLKRDASSGR
jgi:propionate catabolism operon transcriptional regulator